MEKLLTDKNSDEKELTDLTNDTVKKLFSTDFGDLLISYNYKGERWFEEVRPIDVFCCISRMRGVTIKSTGF